MLFFSDNFQTIGGHIVVGGTDVVAILLAVGCQVTITKAGGKI